MISYLWQGLTSTNWTSRSFQPQAAAAHTSSKLQEIGQAVAAAVSTNNSKLAIEAAFHGSLVTLKLLYSFALIYCDSYT